MSHPKNYAVGIGVMDSENAQEFARRMACAPPIDRDAAKLTLWDDLQKSLAIALCHWRPTKATNIDYLKCVTVAAKCRELLDGKPTVGS